MFVAAVVVAAVVDVSVDVVAAVVVAVVVVIIFFFLWFVVFREFEGTGWVPLAGPKAWLCSDTSQSPPAKNRIIMQEKESQSPGARASRMGCRRSAAASTA